MEQSPTKVSNHKSEKVRQKSPPAVDVKEDSINELDTTVKSKSESDEVQKGGALKETKKKVDKSTITSAAEKIASSVATAGPPIPSQPAPLENKDPLVAADSAEMVDMGGGLPALPPRPVAPIRQAMPSASASSFNAALPQRVPNVKQASKPQFNIPPGSDLGAVGKIGVYQMSHKSSANDIHANLYFWIYIVTLFTTYFIIKRK